jgi:DNA gyrase subunit A
VINLRLSERTGRVVTIRAVQEDEQLMMITRKGVVNRQRVSEISLIGRATQGVKLMNLDDGDSLVDVARIIVEDEVDGPLGEVTDSDGLDEPTGELHERSGDLEELSDDAEDPDETGA